MVGVKGRGGRPQCWSQSHYVHGDKTRKCVFCNTVYKFTSGSKTKGHLACCADAPEKVKRRAFIEVYGRKPGGGDDDEDEDEDTQAAAAPPPAGTQAAAAPPPAAGTQAAAAPPPAAGTQAPSAPPAACTQAAKSPAVDEKTPPALPLRQKTLEQSLNVPRAPHTGEYDKIAAAWARFYHSAAIPFNAVDNPLFREAVELTRPGISWQRLKLNRRSVGGRLLEEEYERVMRSARELTDSARNVTLLVDSWQSNNKKKVLFSIMAVTEGRAPRLVDSGVLGRKRDSASGQRLFEKLDALQQDLKKKASVVLGDGESAVQKACRLFASKYGCESGVCAAHKVGRMVNDMIGTRRHKGKTTPNPFHWLQESVSHITGLIRNSKHAAGEWDRIVSQVTGSPPNMPPSPASHRWSTNAAIFAYVKAHHRSLIVFRTDPDMLAQCPALDTVLDNWEAFAEVEALLGLAQRLTDVLQTNGARMGLAIPAMSLLVERAKHLGQTSHSQEWAEVRGKWDVKLADFTKVPWVCATTALHPWLQTDAGADAVPETWGELHGAWRADPSKALRKAVRKNGLAWVEGAARAAGVCCASVRGEFVKFTTKLIPFESGNLLWARSATTSPGEWWRAAGELEDLVLPDLLRPIMAAPPGTGAIERVFSVMGWQSTRRRNALAPFKVHQLTMVHQHHRDKSAVDPFWGEVEKKARSKDAAVHIDCDSESESDDVVEVSDDDDYDSESKADGKDEKAESEGGGDEKAESEGGGDEKAESEGGGDDDPESDSKEGEESEESADLDSKEGEPVDPAVPAVPALPRRGLRNPSTHCFVNAFVLAWLHEPDVLSTLAGPDHAALAAAGPVMAELVRLARGTATSGAGLRAALKFPPTHQQWDVTEACFLTLESAGTEVSRARKRGGAAPSLETLADLLQRPYKLHLEITCPNVRCQRTCERTDPAAGLAFIDAPVKKGDDRTLWARFMDAVNVKEVLEDSPCPGAGKLKGKCTADTRTVVRSITGDLPEVVRLGIRRCVWNDGAARKVAAPVTVERHVQHDGKRYSVASLVYHTGTPAAGHYYAVLVGSDGDAWKLDDNTEAKLVKDFDETLKSCTACVVVYQASPQTPTPKDKDTTRRCTACGQPGHNKRSRTCPKNAASQKPPPKGQKRPASPAPPSPKKTKMSRK